MSLFEKQHRNVEREKWPLAVLKIVRKVGALAYRHSRGSKLSLPRFERISGKATQHQPELPAVLLDPLGAGLDLVFTDVAKNETCWSPNSEVPTAADLLSVSDEEARHWHASSD